MNRGEHAYEPIREVLLLGAGPVPIGDADVGVVVVKSFLEQLQEDPMPGQQPSIRVLHVHLVVNVDQLPECPVVVDHVERADVA